MTSCNGLSWLSGTDIVIAGSRINLQVVLVILERNLQAATDRPMQYANEVFLEGFQLNLEELTESGFC